MKKIKSILSYKKNKKGKRGLRGSKLRNNLENRDFKKENKKIDKEVEAVPNFSDLFLYQVLLSCLTVVSVSSLVLSFQTFLTSTWPVTTKFPLRPGRRHPPIAYSIATTFFLIEVLIITSKLRLIFKNLVVLRPNKIYFQAITSILHAQVPATFRAADLIAAVSVTIDTELEPSDQRYLETLKKIFKLKVLFSWKISLVQMSYSEC